MLRKRPDGHYARVDWIAVNPRSPKKWRYLYDNKTTTVTTDNFEAERQKAVSEIHSRIAEGCRTRTDFTIGPISIRWAGLLAYVETADVPAVELKEYDADDDGKFMSKLEDRIMEVAYTHKNATKPPRKARKQ